MLSRLYTYRRSLLVGGISVLLFGWCAVSAAPTDNQRFITSLHEAHQGEWYEGSLKELNEGRPAKERLTECTACHSPQDWVQNLVRPLAPISTAACVRCHKVDDKDPHAYLGPVQGKRLVRAGHQAPPPGAGETDLGLRVDPETGDTLALGCAVCHPDHQGQKPVQKVEMEGDDKSTIKRIRMTDVCLGCHVPTVKTPRGEAVLKKFIDSHEAIFEAGSIDEKSRNGVLAAMAKQSKVAEQFCMPACHDEHKPAYGDASE